MAFPYNDLREFLDQVKGFGELKEIGGVGWDREMGAMSEMVVRRLSHRSPALLFDEIPGYPRGFRCLYGMLNSPRRFALSLGIPLEGFSGTMELLRAYRDKTKNMPLVPPRFVDKGPVTENILEGEDIDVLKFPVPVHHELDGGRYIGTADAVITRDPDSGWINSGTYRMQAVVKNKVTIYISPGKHGRLQMDKYLSKGEPCPLVAIVGVDPLLWVGSRYSVPMGVSEFDYCGGIKGEPMELVRGSFTGLPFPSYSEIVLEGEVVPGEKVLEGPFGEWPGYYAGGKKEEPVMTVKRVYHRNHPILTCTASNKPPHPHLFERCFIRSAGLWEALDKAGVPNIKGVWVHEAGAGRTFNVVSIKTAYYGHSRHALVLATHLGPAGYGGRWTIVVDDDIDPSDMYAVIWAMGTRCDPATDVDFIRKCWSSKIDPMIFDEHYYNSRALVDACIPYEHRDDFAKVAETSPELQKAMVGKYGAIFKEILGTDFF